MADLCHLQSVGESVTNDKMALLADITWREKPNSKTLMQQLNLLTLAEYSIKQDYRVIWIAVLDKTHHSVDGFQVLPHTVTHKCCSVE